MKKMQLREDLGIGILLVVLYGAGLLMQLFLPRAVMDPVTPVIVTIAVGIGLLMGYPRDNGMRFVIWLCLTYMITMFLESLGVNFGLVFGFYIYSKLLGPGIAGVPFLIGATWISVVYGSICLARCFTGSNLPSALLAGIFCLVYDLLLEVVAVRMGYWAWSGGVVPLQNYISWYLIGAVLSYVFLAMRLNPRNAVNAWLIMVQAVYLGGMILFYKSGQ